MRVAQPEQGAIEIPEADGTSGLIAGNDPTPTPTALASALIDVDDIVPPPPTIPEFNPFMGAVKTIASWLDAVLPAYDPNPILNPTQVAAGFVLTLQAALQGTYWNGQPTLFTFGAYILLSAAYQRFHPCLCHWVNWQAIPLALVDAAARVIPSAHLCAVWERLLFDPRENRSGFPDLLALGDAPGDYALIEVKGPGDALQESQKRWLRFFGEQGMPAQVLWVSYSE